MGLDLIIYKLNKKINSTEDLESAYEYLFGFGDIINRGHTAKELISTIYKPSYVEKMSSTEIEKRAANLREEYSLLEDKLGDIFRNVVEIEVMNARNYWSLLSFVRNLYEQDSMDKDFNAVSMQILVKRDIEEFLSGQAKEYDKLEKDEREVYKRYKSDLERLIKETNFEKETLYVVASW